MPQLDFSTYLPQMFWMVIIFGSFVALCSFVLLPRLKFISNTRDQFVQNNLEQAQKNSDKIKELELQIELINKKALLESDKIIEDAKKQSELIIQQHIAKADEEYRNLFREETLKFEELSSEVLKSNEKFINEMTNKIVAKLKE
jgi:F0F1-type ATP synthase membrane subunit b/b'